MASDCATPHERDGFVRTACEDFFSLDRLISRVEQIREREQLEHIHALALDAALLQQLIATYQRQWRMTLILLEKTQMAVASLRNALEHCCRESVAAERAWLASWGIQKGSSGPGAYSPAGWV
jgi:ABC-type molybdate transport system ATPase subunit